jgi:hypothetical protein
MTEYSFTEIKDSEIESIKTLLGFMCKENNIHQERQNYKISFNKEKIFIKNNHVLFTSGSKKYLSFYGKVYLNQDSKIIETIHSESQNITIEPSANSVLIISGGVSNSTTVENEEDVLYFYIAPSLMLDMHEPGKWQNI